VPLGVSSICRVGRFVLVVPILCRGPAGEQSQSVLGGAVGFGAVGGKCQTGVGGEFHDLYALTRTGPHASPETEAEPEAGGGGEVGERASIGIDLKSLSLTERVMMWDRAASVVKERNPEVRVITERSTSEIADVVRLTHDERANQRTIADRLGLNDRIVRAIQRAGQDVLGRTDPGALQVD
jgi:hypothetical protein